MKFSIIIPVYNVERWLGPCLDSVMSQSYTDWEAICVDDGSTDGSGAILDEYAARDSRFRVIHQANAGVSAARNAALEMMSGDWLLFLDGDDVFNPITLEACSRAILTDDHIDLVKFYFKRFPDGVNGVWNADDCKIQSASIVDVHKTLTQARIYSGLCQHAYCISMLTQIRFKSLAHHEDRVFYTEALCRARRIAMIDNAFYGYRTRPGSATQSGPRKREMSDCLVAFPLMIDFLTNSGKTVPRVAIKQYTGMCLERVLFDSYKLKTEGDRREVWMEWKCACRKLRVFSKGWYRFVCSSLSVLPFKPLAILLCYCPYWLKLKGLHR